MPKILARDSRIINHPVEEVYRTITDFASYSKWYPKHTRIEVLDLDSHAVGTTLKIRNDRLVKWYAKVTKFEPNRLIAIDYIDGAWIGKTNWKFDPKDNKTKLTLEINLEINKPWLRFLSKFTDFRKTHSKQMQQVFDSLEKYLTSENR